MDTDYWKADIDAILPEKPPKGNRVVAEVIGREGNILDKIYNVPQDN